jgi:hypothetical protein
MIAAMTHMPLLVSLVSQLQKVVVVVSQGAWLKKAK